MTHSDLINAFICDLTHRCKNRITTRQLVEKFVERLETELAHKTEDGFCCACNYDVTVMKGKIKAIKDRTEIRKLIPKLLRKVNNMGVSGWWNEGKKRGYTAYWLERIAKEFPSDTPKDDEWIKHIISYGK